MSSPAVLTPDVLRVIGFEAFRAWPSLHRFGFEPADVRQEFLLHVLGRAGHYDERRSAESTYFSHLCRNRKLQIIESASAMKRGAGAIPRSLSEPVGFDEGESVEFGDSLMDDDYTMRTGRRSRPAAELMTVFVDVDKIVSGLPAELADVARLLAAGESLVEVARQLKISRATVHRRIVRLRNIFRQSGLGGAIGAKEAA